MQGTFGRPSTARAVPSLSDVHNAGGEELLGLFDAIWFGVGTPDDSLPARVSRHKSLVHTVDPLDSVIPVVGFGALLPEVQPNALALPSTQQQPQRFLQQAVPGGAAALISSQQQQQQYIQQQQQPALLQYSAGQPSAAGAKPAPSQPRAMWVPSGNGTASRAAYAASPPNPPLQQQQQQAQQQLQSNSNSPSPFVLGTWAQRQYIMPVQRPAGAQSPRGAAAAESHPLAEQPAAQRGSSSPARPIPRGKLPSSNGSSHSSASTRGKAAQAQHSSSGGSSEPPPPSNAQQAAAAEAAAAAAGSGEKERAHGDDAAAAAMWRAAAEAEAEVVAAAGAAGGVMGGRRSMGTDDEEEAVQQIAWRWRFARRWQAEQTRAPLDPAATASPGDGGMEEALQYLAACGENWQHISRESSRLGTVESRLLGTLGSLGCLGSELLADESFSGASAFGMQTSLLQDTADSGGVLAAACAEDSKRVSSDGQTQQVQEQEQQAQQAQQRRRHKKLLQPRGEATVEVTGITKKAQEMLAAQKEFSKAAKERWQLSARQAGSSMWVGALLEGVQVDDWGKFKFLLMRLKDRNGRQVLLVRGANNRSESGIVEELHNQMVAACSAQNLPVEQVEVMGGGTMEWMKHRDRHLHISGGYVSRTGGSGGPCSGTEVMRLAAVLTQQALPMHYKVTSDGDGKKL